MDHPLALSHVRNTRPGWYRGDFHAHTNCSDGFHPFPALIDVARAEGLDFVAVTDHNTVDAFAHLDEAPDLLVVPGVEVTLKEGHFNVFGMTSSPGWLEAIRTGRNAAQLGGSYPTTDQIMRQASSGGLLVSINHPLLAPWEWREWTTALQYLDCIEIWNDPSWADNRKANPATIEFWTRALNDGYRITAIGGSDYHRPAPRPGENKPPDRLGLPSTYVYAEALSGAAILTALREHRAYVSMGPQATLQAHADGATYNIGDDLGRFSGPIELEASVGGSRAPGTARLIKNGATIAETRLLDGTASLRLSATVEQDETGWFRFDVIDSEGLMLAITNPIFVGPRCTPTLRTFGDLLD